MHLHQHPQRAQDVTRTSPACQNRYAPLLVDALVKELDVNVGRVLRLQPVVHEFSKRLQREVHELAQRVNMSQATRRQPTQQNTYRRDSHLCLEESVEEGPRIGLGGLQERGLVEPIRRLVRQDHEFAVSAEQRHEEAEERAPRCVPVDMDAGSGAATAAGALLAREPIPSRPAALGCGCCRRCGAHALVVVAVGVRVGILRHVVRLAAILVVWPRREVEGVVHLAQAVGRPVDVASGKDACTRRERRGESVVAGSGCRQVQAVAGAASQAPADTHQQRAPVTASASCAGGRAATAGAAPGR